MRRKRILSQKRPAAGGEARKRASFLCHRTAISYDIEMLRITETKCKVDMTSEKH